jgi:hypothetical protein
MVGEDANFLGYWSTVVKQNRKKTQNEIIADRKH